MPDIVELAKALKDKCRHTNCWECPLYIRINGGRNCEISSVDKYEYEYTPRKWDSEHLK